MRTDWYKDVNPNLDRLAQILGMAGGNKPSHGYTIAEKAPEVVTAPGVYFPAEKGEVIPLQSRQTGGSVTPSKPSSKDNETRKLDILESIIASIKPAGLESNSLMGLTIPPEPLKIEQSKYDILKSAISILKPPAQQKSSSGGGGSSQTKTPSPKSSSSDAGVNLPIPPKVPTSMEGIPTPQSIQPEIRTDSPEINPMSGNLVNLNREDNLSTQMFPRQGGGKVFPPTLQEDGDVEKTFRDPQNAWEKLQMDNWGPGASRIVGGNRVQWQEGMTTPFEVKKSIPEQSLTKGDINAPLEGRPFPSLPGIPKPPTAQSYGIQPGATKLGVADKGISEGDLLWQKKRAEAGWANPAQDLWEHKREEGMKAGQWSTPMFSRADGGSVTPETEEEKRRRLLGESMGTPPQPVPAPPTTEPIPAGLEGFITNINRTPTETVYTGPEGQATVGPERFFLGDKEVPTGTPGAISGDKLARERIFAETKKEESERKLLAEASTRDMGYYAAHPEEKIMDAVTEANRPLMDMYQKLIEENKSRSQGFGMMGMSRKATRIAREQAAKNIVELTKGMGELMGKTEETRQKYFKEFKKEPRATAPHLVQNEKGEYVWATPGGVLPAGIMGKAPQQKEYQPHAFIKPDGTVGWVEPGKEVPGGWKPYEKPEKPEKPERLSMTDVTARFNGKMRGIKQRMMVDMTPDEQAFVANQPEGNLLALLLSGKIGQKLSPELKEQYKQEALDAEKEFEELSGGIVGRKGGKLPEKSLTEPEPKDVGGETISSRGEEVPRKTTDKQGREMIPDPTSKSGWRYKD